MFGRGTFFKSSTKHTTPTTTSQTSTQGGGSDVKEKRSIIVTVVNNDNVVRNERKFLGCVPVVRVVQLFTLIGVVVGLVFGAFATANIVMKGNTMSGTEMPISAASIALWLLLALISGVMFVATWRDRVKLFTYASVLFGAHWILDLAVTVVRIFFAFKSVSSPLPEVCDAAGLETGCRLPVPLNLILATVGQVVFKLGGLVALYVMYLYRRMLLRRTHQRYNPNLTIHVPPKKNPFTLTSKNPREKRPWPPTNIPTIKIDLASDQSSASSYSNGSSGGSAFAVFEFSGKYPSLSAQSPPLGSPGLGPAGPYLSSPPTTWDEERGDLGNGWAGYQSDYDSPKRTVTSSPFRSGGLKLEDIGGKQVVLPKFSKSP